MIDTELPELNVELLFDLIKWAERDERYLDRFLGWGDWNQSVWGNVVVPDGLVVGDEEEEGLEVADLDELKKDILAGVCGTAYCMAGQAVVQSGYRLIYNTYLDDESTTGADACVPIRDTGKKDDKGRKVYEDAGDPTNIAGVAQDILGLNEVEADNLFNGSNRLDDLRRFANEFCDNRGLPVLFPDQR